MSTPLTRRRFLHAAAAASAPLVLPSRLFGANAPSKQITLGFIGTGSHGTGYNLKSFLQQEDCRAIATCDVFKSRRVNAQQVIDKHYDAKGCAEIADFRALLQREDIDAVVISTPDHWHVPLSMLALAAGKDVFCEKPSLTIDEGRTLVKLVKKSGKVYATGLEDRSVIQYHKLAEAVRNGAIGKLRHIKVGLPHKGKVWAKEEPAEVPKDLDYNLWQGPAPSRPYSPSLTHNQCWRQIRDYSGGTLTDWGAHIMDTAQVANFAEHGGPVEVEGSGTIPENAMNSIENSFELNYTYANGVTMNVKSAGVYLRFEGEDGWCSNKGWRGGLEAHDRSIFRRTYDDNKIWSLPPGEHRNFLDCVKSRALTTYPAEDMHRLSTAMHIGNIALQLGRKLKWNPDSEAFVDDAKANAMRVREAREWAG